MSRPDAAIRNDELLRDLAAAADMPVASVLRRALVDLDRCWRGPAEERTTTGPFRRRFSDRPADASLRQVDATNFILEAPIRYIADGAVEGLALQDEILINKGNKTDLASVPPLLTWLVPRYGRHSLPALLHDHLQRAEHDGGEPFDPDLADKLFRETMADSGVPLVRRWLMWAAVNLRTRFKQSRRAKPIIVGWSVLWGLAALAGPVLIVRHFGTSPTSTIATTSLVLVLPLAQLSVRWRYRKLACISAYGIMGAAWPGVAVVAGMGLYLAAEWIGSALTDDPAPIFNLGSKR